MTKALIKVNPADKSIDFAGEWVQQRDELLSYSSNIKAVNAENNAEAGRLLKEIGKHSNLLEKARKDYVKPINDQIKKIKTLTDAQRAGLEAEKERLKKTIGAFEIAEQQRLQRIKQEKAMEAARKEAERQAELERLRKEKEAEHQDDFFYDPSTDAELAQKEAEAEAQRKLEQQEISMQKQKAEGSTVKIRENWTFEIEDVSSIPNVFMMPDMQKIGAFVRQNKELTNIPGIKVICQKSVSA